MGTITMTLSVALNNIGKKAWLGGIQYLHNLIRAVRTLPRDEQPDLTLLLSAWDADPAMHAEVAKMVDMVVAYPTEAASPWILLRRRANQFISRRPYLTYSRVFKQRQVNAFFPLTQIPDTPLDVNWIAWAWDLQHKHLPDYFPAREIARRDAVFAAMVERAPLIVTSSHDALEDFDHFYTGARTRLRVLNFATPPLPEWYADDVTGVRAKYNLPQKFLALPNTFWVHKNHRLAFEAIRELTLNRMDVRVVCTGGTHDSRRPDYFGEIQKFTAENQLENHIRILGVLPRHDQLQIMRASCAVLQPSLFEGWSTVVEDARALGKAIIISDIGVHREQNPPKAIFFDPHRVESLVNAISSSWNDLAAGPNLKDEEIARQRQIANVQTFARRFIEIASEG
ncbi:MAG: glycosyltransferase family 4 protein [Chloroflexi bacterium]|nr:glycosyltransferase family 4 protein [Chloroflexota bacterium]